MVRFRHVLNYKYSDVPRCTGNWKRVSETGGLVLPGGFLENSYSIERKHRHHERQNKLMERRPPL